MLRWFSYLHPVVMLMALGCALMLLPAGHALSHDDLPVARAFFYAAILFGFLTLFLGIALASITRNTAPHMQLMAFAGIYVLVPLMLAVPFHEAVGNTSFLNAYVEMVSSLTTTGATLFPEPGRLPASVHLWRGLVGWLGGYVIWVGAIALLAPMALGGFEILAGAQRQDGGGSGLNQIEKTADLPARIRAYAARLFPLYTGLTLILWLLLLLVGETPFIALMHALATLSTSGISPVGGLTGGTAGVMGEVVVAIFFVFAISRLASVRHRQIGRLERFLADPEVRLAAGVIALTTVLIFLRHWVGAYEVDEELNWQAGLAAAWGSVFTVTSFLTTTGFESRAWSMAQGWSGLQTPGLILMGLALIGGGVGTTAGGAKLLRVYALYKHGLREIEKLIHPHSVGGAGREARHIRRGGAYLAWLTFMLMALAVAAFMLAFALTGESFEDALVLTIAGLTTTGPMTVVAPEVPIDLGALIPSAKLILTAAMVVGRLETLAIVALFNPELWRR